MRFTESDFSFFRTPLRNNKVLIRTIQRVVRSYHVTKDGWQRGGGENNLSRTQKKAPEGAHESEENYCIISYLIFLPSPPRGFRSPSPKRGHHPKGEQTNAPLNRKYPHPLCYSEKRVENHSELSAPISSKLPQEQISPNFRPRRPSSYYDYPSSYYFLSFFMLLLSHFQQLILIPRIFTLPLLKLSQLSWWARAFSVFSLRPVVPKLRANPTPPPPPLLLPTSFSSFLFILFRGRISSSST